MPCGDGEKSGTLLRFAQKYDEFMKFKNDTFVFFYVWINMKYFLRGNFIFKQQCAIGCWINTYTERPPRILLDYQI